MTDTISRKIRNFISAPLRFRTGRGFGVHSPFAFKFILDVLTEKLPYYAYDVIVDATSRLIFRVAVYFRPHYVALLGTGCASVSDAILLAAPDAIIGNLNLDSDFIVVTPGIDSSAVFNLIRRKLADRQNFVVVVNRLNNSEQMYDLSSKLCSELTYGMTFGNNKIRIFTLLTKLSPQHFNLWL